MVAEFYWPEHSVLTVEQRSEFMLRGTIPNTMNVKIARCGEGDMRSFLSVQSSAAGSADGNRRSVQATTIGFGDLLAHVVVSTLKGFDPDQIAPFTVPIQQLWPAPGRAVVWPFPQITAEHATMVAQRVASIANLPIVDWLGTQKEIN